MTDRTGAEKLTKEVRDWLLAILRFAVTLEKQDRATVFGLARQLDRSELNASRVVFAFFTRTSFEFCEAISERNKADRATILRRQLSRIPDPRLKRAIEAAIDFAPEALRKPVPKEYRQSNLWEGLAPH